MQSMVEGADRELAPSASLRSPPPPQARKRGRNITTPGWDVLGTWASGTCSLTVAIIAWYGLRIEAATVWRCKDGGCLKISCRIRWNRNVRRPEAGLGETLVRLDPLDDGGDALADADAHRDERIAATGALQLPRRG